MQLRRVGTAPAAVRGVTNEARAAFAPSSALRITAKDCAAVAFVGTRTTACAEVLPYAVVFTGRARKPHRCSGTYRNAAQRDRAVRDAFEAQAKREQAAKARREAAKAARANHKITVGACVVTSWGYDQTNVDAYEVIKVSGQMITLRRCHTRTVSEHPGSDRVQPVPGTGYGETMRRRVSSTGDGVKISDGRGWAYLWDGERSYHRTASGFGH